MKYSKEFQSLINDPSKFADIMKYNCSGLLYSEWEQKRKFIADYFTEDGTILDIGSAGGLFLKSVQEWSGNILTPYGVDIIPEYIDAAKELFSQYKDNFAVLDVRNISNIDSVGLPTKYDYVFWNYLGPKYFEVNRVDVHNIVKFIINMSRRRAVFGFYAPNKYKYGEEGWREERNQLTKRVENFKKLGFKTDGELYNPTNYNQAIVWIDK